ncbi:hypothetical protein [Oribacterium sp. FC2011]|uniref:hypothetical protein n=1 Tax=Oribacterium sp. FC2011 TaxID=1408311 RepID=UPI000B1BA9A7|nr:hypothetical protein [Oribacterium sp. FC2011]
MIGADPAAAASETELGAAFWPQIILAIMIVLSVVNIVTSLKKMKADGKTVTSDIDVAGFFKSKLFIGILRGGYFRFFHRRRLGVSGMPLWSACPVRNYVKSLTILIYSVA